MNVFVDTAFLVFDVMKDVVVLIDRVRMISSDVESFVMILFRSGYSVQIVINTTAGFTRA